MMAASQGPRVALLVIDLIQRIVALPAFPHAAADVVQRSVALADSVRHAGGVVVWVRVERPGVDVQPPGSDFVAEIKPRPDDLVVVKRTWGAFQATGLDDELHRMEVRTLWLTGIATNFGVESTARVADELGYEVVLVEDAMSGSQPGEHEFAMSVIFPRLGRIARAHELLARSQ